MSTHSQDWHTAHNAIHYPGTRQLCSVCEDPTLRCEEDGFPDGGGGWLCETHHEELKEPQP
jgi:hypothetical protein